MSRTTRNREYFWKTLFASNNDPRCDRTHGRDGKPCSLLYGDYIGQRGWDRDYYNGIAGRRYHKKSNRRWQRRNARKMMEREDWG